MMPEPGGKLRYRDADGAQVEVVIAECGERLSTSAARLRSYGLTIEHRDSAPQEVRLVCPAGERASCYEALDNEILAGLRLSRVSRDLGHPATVSRLVGHDGDAARPYALLEPYRGRPVGATMGKILPSEKARFQESLLLGLRWIAAAGIAHRGISPRTVHWDGGRVQITDFSDATLVGAPRGVVGDLPWAAPEQRAGQAEGTVTVKDDVWAAGRLIFYVVTGGDLVRDSQLVEEPELGRLLAGIFGPMDDRPELKELLARLNMPDPIPRPPGPGAAFRAGTMAFADIRAVKHPHTRPCPEPMTQAEPPAAEPPPRRRRWARG